MARKRPNPVVRAVTDMMWKRDQLEMQAADRLLSAIELRRRPAKEPRRRPSRRLPGFRSVLCPIDFSEQSRLALRYAAAVARRGSARLIVSYANDPLLVAAAAAALHDRRVARRSLSELRTFIDATLKPDASKRLRLKTQVSVGSPADEILKAAARGGSDLIVMGTHGLTGANRLLMGSTTLSVLQRTTIPVLAVPWAVGASNAGPSPSWPGERIAAALELGGSAAGADVDAAARIAKWFGSSLLLLHVVGNIAAPDWLGGDLERGRTDSCRACATTGRRAGHPGPPHRPRRRPGELRPRRRRDRRAGGGRAHRTADHRTARPPRLVWRAARLRFLPRVIAGRLSRPRAPGTVVSIGGGARALVGQALKRANRFRH